MEAIRTALNKLKPRTIMQALQSDPIAELKHELNEDLEADRISWDTIAYANLEGNLWEKVWNKIVADGTHQTAFSWVFTRYDPGERRRQYLRQKYRSRTALHTWVRAIVEVVADRDLEAAKRFRIVLRDGQELRSAGPSGSSSNPAQGSGYSSNQPQNQFAQASSQQDQYDSNSGISPQSTLNTGGQTQNAPTSDPS